MRRPFATCIATFALLVGCEPRQEPASGDASPEAIPREDAAPTKAPAGSEGTGEHPKRSEKLTRIVELYLQLNSAELQDLKGALKSRGVVPIGGPENAKESTGDAEKAVKTASEVDRREDASPLKGGTVSEEVQEWLATDSRSEKVTEIAELFMQLNVMELLDLQEALKEKGIHPRPHAQDDDGPSRATK